VFGEVICCWLDWSLWFFLLTKRLPRCHHHTCLRFFTFEGMSTTVFLPRLRNSLPLCTAYSSYPSHSSGCKTCEKSSSSMSFSATVCFRMSLLRSFNAHAVCTNLTDDCCILVVPVSRSLRHLCNWSDDVIER